MKCHKKGARNRHNHKKKEKKKKAEGKSQANHSAELLPEREGRKRTTLGYRQGVGAKKRDEPGTGET